MNKEKVLIISLILIFAFGVVAIVSTKSNEEENAEQQVEENVSEENVNEDKIQNIEKYVEVKQDGSKENTSNKLKETKKLGNLEFSNINLKSEGNESYITATVKNTGTVLEGDKAIRLIFLDDKGNKIITVTAYVDTIEPQMQASLRCTTSADFTNAYDFTVSEY